MSQDPSAQMNGAKPLWTIGRVQDQPVLGSNNTFVDGKSVEVIFWDGSTELISVPKSQYNDTVIQQAAQQAAEKHLRVKALQGPTVPPDLLAY